MLKFFRLPFATTGDKTAVPDAVDSNGNVSYSQGYGFDYQRQKTDPAAKNIERDKMNQLFFDITTAIAETQSQGVPDFITTALNGGAPFGYAQYAIVRYLGELYISLTAANVALPTDTANWAPFSAVLRGLGITPPQFDSDTSLATTAFVQRALGNLAGLVPVASGGTIPASAVGNTIIPAGGTITLPLANTVPEGACLYIKASAGSLTINRQGADTITLPNSGSVNSFSILSLSTAKLRKGGSTVWELLMEDGGLQFSPYYASSMGTNGYQKLPSGLIIQWGSGTSNATAGQPTTVTYPTAFPFGALSNSIIRTATAVGADSNTFVIDPTSSSSFVVRCQQSSATFRWIAIGY